MQSFNENDQSYDANLICSPIKTDTGLKIGHLQPSKEFKSPMNIPGHSYMIEESE